MIHFKLKKEMAEKILFCLFILVLTIFFSFLGYDRNILITGDATRLTIANTPPVLNKLDNITVYEGNVADINSTGNLSAYDIDQDILTFYFEAPFNSSGQWQTFIGSAGNYYINVSVDDNSGGVDWQIVEVIVLASEIPAPKNIEIFLNDDEKSVDLNWTEVDSASEYIVYYHDNVTHLKDITNPGIVNFTVTDNNWTDSGADQVQTRFYRVGAKNNALLNVNETIVGKHTYYLKASSDESKQTNTIASPFFNNYTMSGFLDRLQDCKSTTQPSKRIIIQTVNRTNPEQQPWTTHIEGFDANADYKIDHKEGYFALVHRNCNVTFVGEIERYNVYLTYVASSDQQKQTNLIGVPYPGRSMSKYASEVSDSFMIIQTVNRTNPEQQPWITHIKGFDANAYYRMSTGEGYYVKVKNTLNHNVTW